MLFKISFSMTCVTWRSYCVIFQIRKRNNELIRLRSLFVVIFLFNQSKNIAALEQRTGHFRELVGFEAKDLSFEGKFEDFKMYPRDQGRL